MADCFAQLESIATETSTTNQHDAIIAYRLYLAGHSIHLLNESAELLQHTLALVCTCVHSQESYLRDMACSTLSLLCNGCKHMPVLADSNGVQALLAQMDSLLNSLEPRQVFKKKNGSKHHIHIKLPQIYGIYGAVATVISASPEPYQQQQIPVLMHTPNEIVSAIDKVKGAIKGHNWWRDILPF